MRVYRTSSLVLTATYLAACTHHVTPVDPCARVTFNAAACQQAVAQRGYYYQGSWVPQIYPSPYSFYYGMESDYLLHGGHVYYAPYSMYSRSYVPYPVRANSYMSRITGNGATGFSRATIRSLNTGTVSRGGFGSIGGGRSAFGGIGA